MLWCKTGWLVAPLLFNFSTVASQYLTKIHGWQLEWTTNGTLEGIMKEKRLKTSFKQPKSLKIGACCELRSWNNLLKFTQLSENKLIDDAPRTYKSRPKSKKLQIFYQNWLYRKNFGLLCTILVIVSLFIQIFAVR